MKEENRFQVSWSMYTHKIKNSTWMQKLGSVRVWYTNGRFARATRRVTESVSEVFKKENWK